MHICNDSISVFDPFSLPSTSTNDALNYDFTAFDTNNGRSPLFMTLSEH
jgi:hypothetical protein